MALKNTQKAIKILKNLNGVFYNFGDEKNFFSDLKKNVMFDMKPDPNMESYFQKKIRFEDTLILNRCSKNFTHHLLMSNDISKTKNIFLFTHFDSNEVLEKLNSLEGNVFLSNVYNNSLNIYEIMNGKKFDNIKIVNTMVIKEKMDNQLYKNLW